jgi:hypothetical protein
LFSVIDKIGAKLIHDSEHYNDDSVANSKNTNVIAETGRRLKSSMAPVIVFVAIFLLFIVAVAVVALNSY